MKADEAMNLPTGTGVYCCPHGLILDFSWRSRVGVHIIRANLPLALCTPEQRPALRAAARDFCQLVEAERRTD